MDELLVEIGAQPRQLFLVAKLGRGDHLVEAERVSFIIQDAGRIRHRAVGADGLHALVPVIAFLALALELAFLAFARLALLVALGRGFGAHVHLPVGLTAGLILIAFLAVVTLLGLLALFARGIFGIGRFGLRLH